MNTAPSDPPGTPLWEGGPTITELLLGCGGYLGITLLLCLVALVVRWLLR